MRVKGKVTITLPDGRVEILHVQSRTVIVPGQFATIIWELCKEMINEFPTLELEKVLICYEGDWSENINRILKNMQKRGG